MAPALVLLLALLCLCDVAAPQQSPVPRSDQGPFLLQYLKGTSTACLEAMPNHVNVVPKSCSKTSAQQFYYSPTLGAFKLFQKCLGIGPVGGGLQLLTCPERANENFKATWTCHPRQRECCVAANSNHCVKIKDGTSWLPAWLPDVDMGSPSGIWRMVVYFILFTLLLDLVMCGLRLAINFLRFLLGFLQKREPEVDMEAPTWVPERKPLAH
eukprot:GGOE01061162.1.p2 GENE.GGOE01061162.1~~GGOE01061162.1.p2  ORF type:complete len:220 (-),score=69.95 GGOE01061162.1:239-874(-)